MPKTVPCPVCRSKVKVPASAKTGAVLACPDCDERFTPPHLVERGRGLDDEEAYEVHESRDEDDFESAERKEKRRKARAIKTAGSQYAERFRDKRAPFFSPFDIVLLVLAVAAALGGVVGLVLAKKEPSIGMMAVIIITFCVVMFVFAYRKLLMRK